MLAGTVLVHCGDTSKQGKSLASRLHTYGRLGKMCVVEAVRKASTGWVTRWSHWPEWVRAGVAGQPACRRRKETRHDGAEPGLGQLKKHH